MNSFHNNDILRRLPVAALFLFCLVPMAFSQSANALYLNDGSRVIGYVLQLDSAGDVSIRTTDGQMRVIPMSDVDNINWSYEIKPQGPGAIYRFGDKFRWKFSDVELTDSNYDKYFDDDLYHTYVGGSNQFNLGGACLVYGVTCLVLSILEFDPWSDKQTDSFYAYAGGANLLICLGSIFTGIGKGRLNWVERTFNEQNAATNELSSSSKILNSIKLNPSVLMSSQRDLALGASFSISF